LLDYGILLAPFYAVSGLFVPPINVEELPHTYISSYIYMHVPFLSTMLRMFKTA